MPKRMQIDLSDRTVVITGGSQGIGRATALEFARQGCRVAVAARTEADLQATVQDIEKAGGRGMYVVTDLREKEQIRELVQRVLQEWGRIDVWINNAGVNVDYDTLMAAEEWVEAIFAVNLEAVYWGMRYAAHAMMSNNGDDGGIIVNVSSLASEMPTFPRFSLYKATKKAVDILSEGVALELAPTSIEVINVLPGFTATDFSAHQLGEPAEKGRPTASDWMRIDPSIVARKIVRAVSAGRSNPRVTVTMLDRIGVWLAEPFTGVVNWMNRRQARGRKLDESVEKSAHKAPGE